MPRSNPCINRCSNKRQTRNYKKMYQPLSEQTYKNIELVVADDHYRSYAELSDGEKIYHSNKN